MTSDWYPSAFKDIQPIYQIERWEKGHGALEPRILHVKDATLSGKHLLLTIMPLNNYLPLCFQGQWAHISDWEVGKRAWSPRTKDSTRLGCKHVKNTFTHDDFLPGSFFLIITLVPRSFHLRIYQIERWEKGQGAFEPRILHIKDATLSGTHYCWLLSPLTIISLSASKNIKPIYQIER